MNQFKKAKRDRVNSGKPIEKASDLTTAGTTDIVAPEEDTNALQENVKQVEVEVKLPLKNETEEEVKEPQLENDETELILSEENQETKEDISPIKEEIELPVETKLDTSDTTVSNPKETVSSQPELIQQVTIPKPVAPVMEATIPEEQQVQPEFPSEPVPVVQKIIVEPETVMVPEVINKQEIPQITSQAVYQPITQTPVHLQPQPILQQTIVQPTQMPTIQAIPAQAEPMVMPIQTTGYPIMQDPVVAPVVKETPSKKNAPNIFHNKGESKSVRKSLVLKPTSVKIAENYCSKNGGSFNELIQHLLDNFIDEYGLR